MTASAAMRSERRTRPIRSSLFTDIVVLIFCFLGIIAHALSPSIPPAVFRPAARSAGRESRASKAPKRASSRGGAPVNEAHGEQALANAAFGAFRLDRGGEARRKNGGLKFFWPESLVTH